MDRKEELAKAIKKREKSLRDLPERKNFESVGEKIARYFAPHRELFTQELRKGKKSSEQAKELYDTTGVYVARVAAEGTHGHLISPRTRWYRRKTGIYDGALEVDEIPSVASWLEQVERVEYGTIARSNFYSIMAELLLDGWTVGTAVGGAEWDWSSMRPVFHCYSPGECVIAENSQGTVDHIYRRYTRTVSQAYKEYPGIFDDDPAMQKKLEDRPDDELEFIHAVYPRDDRDTSKFNAVNKKYASVYVWLNAPNPSPRVVKESGYDNFPYLVWRFSKVTGDVYGRSPAWNTLWDVMYLNGLKKGLQNAVQLATDPMWAIPQEWEDTWRIAPGATQFYMSDPNRIGRPMYPESSHSMFSLEILQDIREQVASHFKVQYFMMMQETEKEMTATEVMERSGEKATLLGPSIGRLTTELLLPLMDILFDMISKAGMTPAIPEELAPYAGKELKIDFVGPLMQTQERFISMQPIKNFLAETLPIVEFWPEMRDNIDPDMVVRQIHQATGAPIDVLNSIREVKEMRKMRADQQQMMAEMQARQMESETAKNTAQATQGVK